MKTILKYILFIGLLFISINGYSQIVFEKGYFIDNNGNKNNCLIKNIDWKDNPVEFKYKLLGNSETKTRTIDDVMEFGIINQSKYLRLDVGIDRSGEKISNLSKNRNAVFQEETLFLKVVVEGKAKLYSYTDSNLTIFFYKLDDEKVQQLVFKHFKTLNALEFGINEKFKQQLSKNLKCDCISLKDIKYLKYNSKKLSNLFIKYNNSTNQGSISFDDSNKDKKNAFNLSIRMGLNNSSLYLHKFETLFSNEIELNFENKLSYRIGVELEFVLPFNKNKWAIIIEPTYQYYNPENEMSSFGLIKAKYSSIEFPIGVRHYFFLNNNSKLFVDLALLFDFNLDSKFDLDFNLEYNNDKIEVSSSNNLALGLGYNYQNRYILELRYHTPRNLINDFTNWDSKYNVKSIIFGYTIF